MKKIYFFCVLCCMLSLLCGCSSLQLEKTEYTHQEDTAENIPIVHLTTFTSFETIQGAGKETVEASINSYLKENGYPFGVQLDIYSTSDYITICNLNLANGVDLDVFLTLSLSNHVAHTRLLPLDDYFENELQEAVSLFDKDWLDCTLFKGKHYAIPAHTTSAMTLYYICRADLIEEMNVDISRVTDINSLEMLFEQIKEHYPQMWCTDTRAITTADILNVSPTNVWGFISSDCGIGIRKESDNVVENYYASNTFSTACEIARRWYEKGYLNPAGCSDTTYCPDYIASGESFGWLVGNCNTAETEAQAYELICGRPLVAIPVGEAVDSNAGFTWAIAKSSEHPREAAQLLNLLYTDPFVLNTICYGLEGEDYSWNEDHSMVSFPNGQDRLSVPYSYFVGVTVLGDRLKSYPFAEYNTHSDLQYIQNKIQNPLRSPAYGMSFDTESISEQITAVSNVVDQYAKALLSGELDNARFLPLFISDLKTAGIDIVVDEAQRQYDAWSFAKSKSE